MGKKILLKQALIISTFSLSFAAVFGAAIDHNSLTQAKVKSMPRTGLKWNVVSEIIPTIDVKRYPSAELLRSAAERVIPDGFKLVCLGVYADKPDSHELFSLPIYESKTNNGILSINECETTIGRDPDPSYSTKKRFFIIIGGGDPRVLKLADEKLELLESYASEECQHAKEPSAVACDQCIVFEKQGNTVWQLPALKSRERNP